MHTDFFSRLLDLFFPPVCASCKKEGDFFCEECQGSLKIRSIGRQSISPSRKDFKYLDAVIYGLDYNENPGIQAALKQLKYKFTQDLVAKFGTLLAEKLTELKGLSGRQLALVPVPLHKKRLNERGFNQAELIARSICEHSKGEWDLYPLLQRVKYTAQQAKLGKRERSDNLKNAFDFMGDSEEMKRKICFLVDDVCTTGSTLDSCAKVLKEAGFEKVYGLVVARSFG